MSFIILQNSSHFKFNFTPREFSGKTPFVGYFEMKSPTILLVDPETVKSVMVKNFKNFHDNTFSRIVRKVQWRFFDCRWFLSYRKLHFKFLDFQTDKDVDPLFGRNPFMLRGEEWKEKRAEITPAFSPSRVNVQVTNLEVLFNPLFTDKSHVPSCRRSS